MRKIVSWIVLLLSASSPDSLFGDTFWDALAMIESNLNDRAIGHCREISRYQILPDVWRYYCRSTAYTNAQVALAVAEQHLDWLKRQYRRRFKTEPSEVDLCVMWNTGFAGFVRRGLPDAALAPILQDRADRFLALRGTATVPSLVRATSGPRAKAQPGFGVSAVSSAGMAATPSPAGLGGGSVPRPVPRIASPLPSSAAANLARLGKASVPPDDDRELLRVLLRRNLETLKLLED